MFYFLVIYGLLACENGAYIEKDDAFRIITDWESGHVPDAISLLVPPFSNSSSLAQHFAPFK